MTGLIGLLASFVIAKIKRMVVANSVIIAVVFTTYIKIVENADRFIQRVDSTAVYVNASTRFTDSGEFGQGCEMGIYTQKLHTRGLWV